jgi:hypothetical protein
MALLATICYPRRKAGQAKRRRRLTARYPRSVGPATSAEEVLRELAFVYQAARSIRKSMGEEPGDRG